MFSDICRCSIFAIALSLQGAVLRSWLGFFGRTSCEGWERKKGPGGLA